MTVNIEFVVVDTSHGLTFALNRDGLPFTALTAKLFAQVRNDEKPTTRPYQVFTLVPF